VEVPLSAFGKCSYIATVIRKRHCDGRYRKLFAGGRRANQSIVLL
jgi:hypothetical protein